MSSEERYWTVNVYFSDDGGEKPTEFNVLAKDKQGAGLKARQDCKAMGWTDIERVEVLDD